MVNERDDKVKEIWRKRFLELWRQTEEFQFNEDLYEDEMNWYLQGRLDEKAKEIAERLNDPVTYTQHLHFRISTLEARVTELEGAWFVDEQIQRDGSLRPSISDTVKRAARAEARVKELEDGIAKHRLDMWGNDEALPCRNESDLELYKIYWEGTGYEKKIP